MNKPSTPEAKALLEWYDKNARTMAWRTSPQDRALGVLPDPYHVWLSEVMLQQTQVATVHSYFLKFVKNWPTLIDLANADTEDVMKAWAGLGYYSRARNLKKCADHVAETLGGKFPDTSLALKTLPGIGDYTSAAIASIAFDEPIAVVDGNVERVCSRYLADATPLPKLKEAVRKFVGSILDADRPGDFAQTSMDIGATICTPKKPACALCPLTETCKARKSGTQEQFPVKLPKKAKPTRKGAAFVITNKEGSVWLQKRKDSGLLGGMTGVPTTDWTVRADGEIGKDAAPLKASWKLMGTAKHTFTHFHLELEVWLATVSDFTNSGWWSSIEDIPNEALPTVMKKVLEAAIPKVTKQRQT